MPRSTTNFISMGADGTATPTFPGGLLLPVVDNLNVTGLRWTKSEVPGYTVGYINFTRLSNLNQLQLFASSDNPVGGNASLSLNGFDSGAGEVRAFVPGHGPTIINSAGQSDFLQMAGALGSHRIAKGTATFTYNGVTSTASVVLNHGLGVAPTEVLMNPGNPIGSGFVHTGWESPTSTQVTLWIQDAAGIVRPNGWQVGVSYCIFT